MEVHRGTCYAGAMFPFFISLQVDSTNLIYAGKVSDLRQKSGSHDGDLETFLINEGKKYRAFHNRAEYEKAVHQLIQDGNGRNSGVYEVWAHLIRKIGTLKGSFDLSIVKNKHELEVITPFISVRNILTGKRVEAIKVACYIQSGFIENAEIPGIVATLRSVGEFSFLKVLEEIHASGLDVLLVMGGYAPKKLRLKEWM